MNPRPALLSLVVLILGSTAAVGTGTAAAAPTATVPASIAADCSVDVTEAMNDWVNSEPDGTILELAPGACYRVDKTLSITDRTTMTLDGNGATIRAVTAGGAVRPIVAINRGSGDTIENVVLVGPNTKVKYSSAHEWQPGIRLSGTTGATVTGVSISDVYGDFVLVTADNKTASHDITIEHSHFDTAGRQGIAIVDADSVEINDVTLGNTNASTFDLESNTAAQMATNVTIENTTAYGEGKIWFSAGGNGVETAANVVVRNNVMTTTQAGDVINVWSPKNSTKGPFLFSGNTLYPGGSKSVAALQLTRARDITVTGNTFYFANYGKSAKFTHETAEYLYKCLNVLTTDNTFVGPGALTKNTGSTSTWTDNVVEQ